MRAELAPLEASCWPLLCGAELLIERFRAECFQLEEPEFEAAGCPAVGVGGYHHERYCEGASCLFCGKVPYWPLWPLDDDWLIWPPRTGPWPHLCEDFPGETPETLYWLGGCCWGGP